MMVTAQQQIDTRALELATIARKQSEDSMLALNRHIDSCARMQRALLMGVITLLVGMVGVLINLYVLPHPH
jgi:hypothetical protein